MSEYQYYEFAAVDAPVLEEDAPYAYTVSSRAEVTPWRWRNVYNFGDFHGSVLSMLEFYDAHVYVTNWGTFEFMLAFPSGLLERQAVEPYLSESWLQIQTHADRTIINWSRGDEEPCDDWLDGEGLLDRLLSIRAELLQGDFRALYLGWLAGLPYTYDTDDADAYQQTTHPSVKLEPPVPPGLAKLTPAQRELADELQLDPDLLQAAAELDVPPPDHDQALQDLLATLTRDAMQAYLQRVANGDGARVGAELNRHADVGMEPDSGPRRSVGALLTSARNHREQRLQRQHAAKARQQQARAAKRQAHLEELLIQADALWRNADKVAEGKTAAAYDQVAETLKELRDAYALASRLVEFQEKLNAFQQRQASRPALRRRLAKLAD